MKEAGLIDKVDTDFRGARAHWGSNMLERVPVHNDGHGLSPDAVQHLGGLRLARAPLQIATWSEPGLCDLAMMLDLLSMLRARLSSALQLRSRS